MGNLFVKDNGKMVSFEDEVVQLRVTLALVEMAFNKTRLGYRPIMVDMDHEGGIARGDLREIVKSTMTHMREASKLHLEREACDGSSGT